MTLEECKEDFIRELDNLTNCGREYAELEWEAYDKEYLDVKNWKDGDAKSLAEEIFDNWDI
ncbi:hypothetical protein [Aliarcobacter lanthieri]|uniref:hypothetical protein n=1 Tax=Aliarcobacter lanthieri TaxID=1355374 RepID=UPI00047A0ABB|nr:hypothetical protein [Aliarcobacter lanthieri]